jgi:hypothetical protein
MHVLISETSLSFLPCVVKSVLTRTDANSAALGQCLLSAPKIGDEGLHGFPAALAMGRAQDRRRVDRRHPRNAERLGVAFSQ